MHEVIALGCGGEITPDNHGQPCGGGVTTPLNPPGRNDHTAIIGNKEVSCLQETE